MQFLREDFMNTAKREAAHGFTQFDLTKKTLNNLSQYNITPTAKLVLLYLTDCYNPKHADVFPKQKTIALKLGISERSVMRAIQELFKAGLILIECKHTNRYILMPNSTSQLSQIDKLSQTECQNVTFTPDNLSHTCIEQKRVTKKEQRNKNVGGNVSDKILVDYAIKHNAKNINAYVNTLKQTKSAEKIINDYNKKNVSLGIAYDYNASQLWLKQQKFENSLPSCTAASCGLSLKQAKIKFGIKK